MPNATSAMPGGVVLDWRHAASARRTVRVLRRPACAAPRSRTCPATRLRRDWITSHAADAADRARLIRAYTPAGGAR